MEICNVEVAFLNSALIAAGLPKAINYDEYMKNASTLEDSYEKAVKRGKKLGTVDIGTGHDSFLKGIRVQADVKYTQYWSMQFQRYHFSDIISSQSKMHRIIDMGVNENNMLEMI